jgi:hypothetical protein
MKIIPFFLLFLLPAAGWGQSFDSVVDFSLDLSSLSDPAVASQAAEDGRIVILEGLMAETEFAPQTGDTGVSVTLIGGSWVGTSEVRAFSCRIMFEGEKWIDMFPLSEPEIIPPGYVAPGSRLLVAARITGYDRESGMSEAVMVDFRVLE